MENKIDLQKIMLILLISAASLARIAMNYFPFLTGLTSMGAIALISGIYFAKWQHAFFFSLVILFISDLVIQNIVYHGQYGNFLYPGWMFVYGSFSLIIILGRRISTKATLFQLVSATISASFLHWIITNLGVWITNGLDITTGQPYTHDLLGFCKCFYLALPFLKNFFLGTLFYSLLLYSIIEWLKANTTLPVCNIKI